MCVTDYLKKAGLNNSIASLKTWLFWLLAFTGAAALVFIYANEIHEQTDPPGRSDFYKFYLSSSSLLQGQAIYWTVPDRSAQTSHCRQGSENKLNQQELDAMPKAIRLCLHPNLNPPLFVALTAPFALLDYPQAWWLWSFVSFISGLWALMLIFKSDTLPTVDPKIKALIGLGFFAYFPTFANSSYGQLTLFLFLDVTLAWLALRNMRNWAAGCWLGAAASIKPFFGLFLIALLISRNWRAACAFIAVCGLGFLLGGLLAGFSAYPDYFTVLREVNWQAVAWNGSYAGFFTRFFGGPAIKAWMDAPMLAKGLPAVCSIATVGVLVAVAVKLAKSAGQKLCADALVAITIPAMLLISPLGWNYYFPLLLISFIVIWNLSVNLSNGRIYRLLLILVTIPTIPWKPYITFSYSPRLWFWDAGVYFYLLLSTFLLITFLAYQANNKNVTSKN
ncbi:MAG: glycosyltransferase family 87 protein [Methylococcaceae bacterium]